MIIRVTETTTTRAFETYQEAADFYNRFLEAHRAHGILKINGKWQVTGKR